MEVNKGGRPAKYSNIEDLSAKIDEYFAFVQDQQIKLTISGLTLFLGFADRQSLYVYKKKSKFSYTIKRAVSRIEHAYELQLFERNPAGAIFALKNFGWSDKQHINIDHTTQGDKIQWIE